MFSIDTIESGTFLLQLFPEALCQTNSIEAKIQQLEKLEKKGDFKIVFEECEKLIHDFKDDFIWIMPIIKRF